MREAHRTGISRGSSGKSGDTVIAESPMRNRVFSLRADIPRILGATPQGTHSNSGPKPRAQSEVSACSSASPNAQTTHVVRASKTLRYWDVHHPGLKHNPLSSPKNAVALFLRHWRIDLNVQVTKLLQINGGRSASKHVARLLSLGERDHVANVVRRQE